MTAPEITLNNGVRIPQLGLGIWQTSPEETERIVRYAIGEAGYRHIDGAKTYDNEEALGAGVRASGVAREEVFVTTKLWPTDFGRENATDALDASLQRLGFDYVDLYLLHWPNQDDAKRIETWLALEDALAAGKVRAIGVANHEPHHLADLLEHGSVVPAVNQIELHPALPQRELRALNAQHGIVTEAWSPLAGGPMTPWGRANPHGPALRENAVIAEIARAHGKSPVQVILRWHMQHDVVAIPKTVTPARAAENIDIFDFELSADELRAIDALEVPDGGGRTATHPDDASF